MTFLMTRVGPISICIHAFIHRAVFLAIVWPIAYFSPKISLHGIFFKISLSLPAESIEKCSVEYDVTLKTAEKRGAGTGKQIV